MKYLMLPLVLLSGCSATTAVNENTKKLCEDTLYQYTQIRDKGTTSQYVDLFTEDATFTVEKLGIELNGQKELATRFESARVKSKSIHLLTSAHVYLSDQGQLSATSNFILFMKDKKAADSTKVLSGRYIDSLVLSNNKCKFKNRDVIVDRIDTL
ncbi:nuclear transport factor 2 family protein [Pseudoalteromonas sp. SMS1]|uniref:nuclear transport factor 2 family protein n=1 Tax=Pseudoalteromonas sp. SMS1 TaxID=2908894 RepID=UPI001F1F8CA9|nr:nuclear transport factor 2 family protein [Pseudoalteromonas sp. SMS1]MCF2858744.1 nuclear transport factor 2 family protein [Pseudoalteromonas sp. SMS1]